jgi:hypothetical protein
MFSALYDKHYIVDDEHTDFSAVHESGWYLSLYAGANALFPSFAKLPADADYPENQNRTRSMRKNYEK